MLAYCNEVSATLGRLLAYVGSIALLGVFIAKMLGVPDVEAAVESARFPWPVLAAEAQSYCDCHEHEPALNDWIEAPDDPKLRGQYEAQ